MTVNAYVCPVIEINLETTDESCLNCNDGTAAVMPEGGTPPYAVSWSTGDTGMAIEGLAPGNYEVTVTDAGGCTVSASFVIAPYECPEFNVETGSTAESCYQCADGTAWVVVSGGQWPYTFNWSTGATDSLITMLAPGSYGVTVQDAAGCEVFDTATVAPFLCPDIALTATTEDISCYGLCDGSIAIVQITGGEGPFTYAWNTGDTTAALYDLCAGTYYLTLTDANGCTTMDTFALYEPALLQAQLEVQDESCYQCADGSAALAAISGGTPPYTVTWSTGDTTMAIEDLAPGSYSVQVQDANGCLLQQFFDIGAFVCPPMAVLSEVTATTCPEACDGAIRITEVIQGTPPFTYAWSGGLPDTSAQYGLCAGQYAVTVTDSLHCPVTDTIEVPAADYVQIGLDSLVHITDTTSGAIFVSLGLDSTQPHALWWEGPNGFSAATEDLTGLTDTGCYQLTLWYPADSSCVVTDTFCIEDRRTPTATIEALPEGIELRPSPASDYVELLFGESRLRPELVELFDATGRRVAMRRIEAGITQIRISVGHLPQGIYFLRLSANDSPIGRAPVAVVH